MPIGVGVLKKIIFLAKKILKKNIVGLFLILLTILGLSEIDL